MINMFGYGHYPDIPKTSDEIIEGNLLERKVKQLYKGTNVNIKQTMN